MIFQYGKTFQNRLADAFGPLTTVRSYIIRGTLPTYLNWTSTDQPDGLVLFASWLGDLVTIQAAYQMTSRL